VAGGQADVAGELLAVDGQGGCLVRAGAQERDDGDGFDLAIWPWGTTAASYLMPGLRAAWWRHGCPGRAGSLRMVLFGVQVGERSTCLTGTGRVRRGWPVGGRGRLRRGGPGSGPAGALGVRQPGLVGEYHGLYPVSQV
jgi:hypothetical protein